MACPCAFVGWSCGATLKITMSCSPYPRSGRILDLAFLSTSALLESLSPCRVTCPSPPFTGRSHCGLTARARRQAVLRQLQATFAVNEWMNDILRSRTDQRHDQRLEIITHYRWD